MACIQPPQNTRNPLPVISAFFPNANKEEQNSGKFSGHPRDTNEGVVIQPFHFPPTKQIWWDRKPQGSSEVLHLSSRRNLRLLVNEKTIRLAIKHFNQSSSPYECFLIGSISIDSREEAVDINIDRFDPGRDVIEKKGETKRKVPTTVVPGDQIVPLTLFKGLSGAENSTTHSKNEFQRTLEVLHSRISGQDTLNLSNFLSLKSTCHAHVDDDEMILNLHFGAVSIVTSIVATPVSPVPIIPTALARNLTGPLRLSDVQGTPKCGFLTMDHTRKLLLLLESDPKAYSLPLIGVWVSGPFTIHHPYIWSCCVRFLHCTAIQERVLASPNTFLLVHYSPAQTSPIFWECSPQVQLDEGLFELYSSYENLHLDEISSPKYTEPLCFELISPGDTMNRALFNQALSSWTKENQNHTNESSLESKANVGNNIVSLEPRPSPSPHPQTTRSPLLMPSVPEVSLSLSFDESSFLDQNPDFHGRNQDRQVFPAENQPILPGKDGGRILPLKKDDKVILKRNPKIHDQENRGDARHVGKQALIDRTPVSSPQRLPLRPITGQVNHAQNPPARGPGIDNHVSVPKGHGVPVGKGRAQNRAINGGHPKAPGNLPKGEGPRMKLPKDGAMNGRGRGSTMKPRENERTDLKNGVKEKQDVEAQGKSVMTRQASHEDTRVPMVGLQGQNHSKMDKKPRRSIQDECAIERDGNTNNTEMAYGNNIICGEEEQSPFNDNSKRVPEREATRMSYVAESSRRDNRHHHYPSDVGINDNQEFDRLTNPSQMPKIDTRVFHQHQPNDEGINGKHDESERNESAFCDSGVGDSTRDITTQHDNDDNELHFTTRQDGGSSSGKKDAVSETRRDPYDLIMRQQQQLQELQHQINLLLLQQSLTQNSPVGIPTPPPTPVSSDKSCMLSSPVRPRDIMVTMGTNTGASLLMGSPVGRGKISVGTSPMREAGRNEEKRRRLRSQKSSPSNSSKTTSGSPPQANSSESSNHHQPVGTFPRESTPSSRESLDGTTDDDELDEKGLVIERLDETNMTLASSIHGVDICEFVGSPESTRGRRTSSDSSPVLGESASMMMQQQDEKQHHQEQGTETQDEDHQFESLLYKNEKLFYDNLLFKVNQLLCEKVGKSEETPNTSHNASPSNQQEATSEENVTHEPTRQEVLMATVKELERIKESNGADVPVGEQAKPGKEYQNYNATTLRSSFVGVLPDHPHINYTSMSVDETLDETILDTESLALKYLNQEQIHEYRQLASNRHGNQGRGPTRALNNIDSFNNGRLVNDVDCTWNNLSMATQDYLQRYNLGGCKKATNPRRSGKSHVISTQALEQRDGDRHLSGIQAAGQSREGSVASIQCSAPPPTPEPRQTETRILDIQRLRNLPKLL